MPTRQEHLLKLRTELLHYGWDLGDLSKINAILKDEELFPISRIEGLLSLPKTLHEEYRSQSPELSKKEKAWHEHLKKTHFHERPKDTTFHLKLPNAVKKFLEIITSIAAEADPNYHYALKHRPELEDPQADYFKKIQIIAKAPKAKTMQSTLQRFLSEMDDLIKKIKNTRWENEMGLKQFIIAYKTEFGNPSEDDEKEIKEIIKVLAETMNHNPTIKNVLKSLENMIGFKNPAVHRNLTRFFNKAGRFEFLSQYASKENRIIQLLEHLKTKIKEEGSVFYTKIASLFYQLTQNPMGGDDILPIIVELLTQIASENSQHATMMFEFDFQQLREEIKEEEGNTGIYLLTIVEGAKTLLANSYSPPQNLIINQTLPTKFFSLPTLHDHYFFHPPKEPKPDAEAPSSSTPSPQQ